MDTFDIELLVFFQLIILFDVEKEHEPPKNVSEQY